MELHQKRDPGQDVQLAIDEFMSIARGLETYGVDPHPVKDHRGTQLYLGINYTGINTFASGKRVQHFRWSEVHKLNYEGKMFIAHLSYFDRESRETVSAHRFLIIFCCTGVTRSFLGSLCRRSTRSDSSAPQVRTVDTFGDVLSNKCYFSRKFRIFPISS